MQKTPLTRLPEHRSKRTAGGPTAAVRTITVQDEPRFNSVAASIDHPNLVGVLRTAGEPLDGDTRTLMESRLGHDFSRVRVHADRHAASAVATQRAGALTVGEHIVFGAHQYEPRTPSGRYVLGHELAHVVQQRGAVSGAAGANEEALDSEAHQVAATVVSGGRPAPIHHRCAIGIQRIDVSPQFLGKDDIQAADATSSKDFVDNEIVEVTLRNGGTVMSPKFVAVTVKYTDGSIMDIPINATMLRNPRHAGEMQITHFRRHTPSNKIVPITWRGRAEDLPDDPREAGTLFFSRDVTPNIMLGYDDAIVRTAFAYAGLLAAIWNAALGARSLVQIFTATQAAQIAAASTRAGAGVGGTAAAARIAAMQEAERQAVQAERNALIAELRAAGAKFTENEIVQIERLASGRVVWLEQGTASAGLRHIMERHGADFARLGVKNESDVAAFIMNTLKTKAPALVETDGGLVFKVMMGGAQRSLKIVVGSNGFVVSAYPVTL